MANFIWLSVFIDNLLIQRRHARCNVPAGTVWRSEAHSSSVKTMGWTEANIMRIVVNSGVSNRVVIQPHNVFVLLKATLPRQRHAEPTETDTMTTKDNNE